MADNRTTVDQLMQAMAANDVEAQERLLSDDILEEYPQSGERIRGKENRRAILENYPGGHTSRGEREKPEPRARDHRGRGSVHGCRPGDVPER